VHWPCSLGRTSISGIWALSANTKFVVGLTGGIGSGKTTVANLFAACGASVIDTDLIAHTLTAPGGQAIAAIAQAFGSALIDTSGAMDRAKMRALVFDQPHERKKLEAILHPLIREACQAQAAFAQGPYVLFVVPLLVESMTWRTQVRRVLVVDCPEEQQVQRVIQRSALTRDQVLAIMATQATRAQRLAVAQDVIDNSRGTEHLAAQVQRLHAAYLAAARVL
jgi:dephospho-CoA kinase